MNIDELREIAGIVETLDRRRREIVDLRRVFKADAPVSFTVERSNGTGGDHVRVFHLPAESVVDMLREEERLLEARLKNRGIEV